MSGRGRKPIGDRAMTPAERQQRVREKLLAEGKKPVTVFLDQALIERLDGVAKSFGGTRSDAIEYLLALGDKMRRIDQSAVKLPGES